MSWSFKPKTDEKRKRMRVNRKDVLKLHGNVCKICGKSEKEAGQLELAHYKAHSKGGNLVFPLCPICHVKYDKGMLTSSELKTIGLTKKEYSRYRPKKSGAKKESKNKDPFDVDLGLASKKKGIIKNPFEIELGLTSRKKKKDTF